MPTYIASLVLLVFTALSAPAAAAGPPGPAQVEVRNPDALRTTTFSLPAGTVSLQLPDEMAAGDTISGTVVVEPAGENDTERQRNQSILSGLVIDVGGDPVPAATGGVTMTLPEMDGDSQDKPPVLALALQERGRKKPGRTLAATEIPYLVEAPMTAAVFMLPTMGQTGRVIRVRGALDGDLANTGLNIGDQTALPLAESPRQAIFRAPDGITGTARLELIENGRLLAGGPYRSVAVTLTAPKTRLQRGETTTLSLTVAGLAGLTQTLPVLLEISPAGVLTMRGGNRQEFTLAPGEVGADGTARRDFLLVGNEPGAWDGIATVRTEPIRPRRYAVTLGPDLVGRIDTGRGRNSGLSGWFERLLHPGSPFHEPFTLVVTPDIAAALIGSAPDTTREILELEPDGRVRALLEFSTQAVDEVSLPILDTGSKEPAYATIKIQIEDVKHKKGSGQPVSGIIGAGNKLWSVANFQVAIGDLPCNNVSRIEPSSWGGGAASGSRKLKMTLPVSDLEPWRRWHEKFVQEGKCDDGSTLEGTLEIFPRADGGDPVRIELADICVTALIGPDPAGTEPDTFGVELSAGGMTLHPPGILLGSAAPDDSDSLTSLQPVLDRIQQICLRTYPPELLGRLNTGHRDTIPAPVDADPGSQWDFLDTNAGVDKGTFYPSLLETLVPALERHLSPGERFLDLGSGDGRVVFLASHLGARATGMEYDPELIRISLEAMEALGGVVNPSTIRFIRGDFFESTWSGYDVIYYFGRGSSERDRLGEKLVAEMDPGSLLIVLHEEKPYQGLELVEESESIKVYRKAL